MANLTMRQQFYKLALSKGNSPVVCTIRQGAYLHVKRAEAAREAKRGKPKVEVRIGRRA